MAFKPRDIKHFFEKWVEWLTETGLLKSFRISYKVIWNLFLIIIAIFIVGGFFTGGVAAGYFASLVKDQPILNYETLKADINDYSETTQLYWANSIPLGKLQTDLTRTNVSLDKVSPNLKHALIATEDELFYEHNGVVPKSVFRAVYQDFTNQPVVTGGSTLTQQLVKNQILTNEVSFERKAKEILLSLRVERFFSKNDILESYLNVVPFGRNASGENIAGINAAAQGIFGVKPMKLNIPEAAFIAGLPKNPFTYTPFENGGGLKKDITSGVSRAHLVLHRMRDAGYINKDQFEKALKYDYKKHFANPKKSSLQNYPYLTHEVERRTKTILAKQAATQQGYSSEKVYQDYLNYKKADYAAKNGVYKGSNTIKEVAKIRDYDYDNMKKHYNLFKELLKNTDNQLRVNGYKVYTTANKKIYDAMQKFKQNYTGYEKDITVDPRTGKKLKVSQPMEVGAILIKNDTGEIISFVGGRDFEKSEVNHATQTTRQNGSTMKPLLVYSPAMEQGITQPGKIVADLPYTRYISSSNDYYKPVNYGGRFHGFETTRNALAQSHNIPAIRLYTKLNPSSGKPAEYLEKMGFTSLMGSDKYNISAALGGLTKGVTVEENTNAFTTFANDGNFIDAFLINKIVDQNGKVIYQHKSKPTHVFSAQTSYLMLDMMRDVIHGGTARNLSSYLNFQTDWAGKSGTSNGWKDSWFVGTNPNVTLGIWTGYDQNYELNHDLYSEHTQQLWAGLANSAYKINPKLMDPTERFNMPAGIVKRTFCGLTGQNVTDLCRKASFVETDLFNEKYAPEGYGDALISSNSVLTLKDDFIKAHYPYLDKSRMTDELWGALNPEADKVKKEAEKKKAEEDKQKKEQEQQAEKEKQQTAQEKLKQKQQAAKQQAEEKKKQEEKAKKETEQKAKADELKAAKEAEKKKQENDKAKSDKQTVEKKPATTPDKPKDPK